MVALALPPRSGQSEGEDMFLLQIEEAEPTRPTSVKTHEASGARLRNLLRNQTGQERQLLKDVQCFNRQMLQQGFGLDIVELACHLTSTGHDVKVRQALGGGEHCFKNLYHEFLLVKGVKDDIVVECSFRSQFRIPCPTASYTALLDGLPDVFVGALSTMLPVVEIVTFEVAHAFEASGIAMPPWRSARSVMSKWAPEKAADFSPSSSSAGSSPASCAVTALSARRSAPVNALPQRCQTAGAPPQMLPAGASRGHLSSLGARHMRRNTCGGTPVLSVKMGFESPVLTSAASKGP